MVSKECNFLTQNSIRIKGINYAFFERFDIVILKYGNIAKGFTMAINRVSLSWVGVKDLNKSKEFFMDKLGLNVFEEQSEYGWIELRGKRGGTVLGVGQSTQQSGIPAGVNAVVTFITDDYDGTKKELHLKGIEFFDEVSGFPGVPRMICFKDPDGNTFQLVEETEGETDKI